MLIVKAHNDGTGQNGVGHYDVEVLITVEGGRRLEAIAKGRVEHHERVLGWRQLLMRIAQETPER